MATIEEQIKALEEEISKTKYNKATQGHIGKLKAKIAALRHRKEKAQAHARSSGGGQGFEVKKSGDASVALVGFPSVGKSSLISQLTEVDSDAGDFAFTTLTCIPGVMEHRGAKIQILDLPGLIKGASEGKGGGERYSMSSEVRTWSCTSSTRSRAPTSKFSISSFGRRE